MDVYQITLMVDLVAAGSLLYALLPWYLAMSACLVPAVSDALSQEHHLPLAGLIDRPSTILVILLTLAVLRWYQLLHRADTPMHFMRRPLIFGLSQNLEQSARKDGFARTGSSVAMDPAMLIRQRPDWMQRHVDLRRTGPGFTQRTLRVALGGGYLPQTWKGRLIQTTPLVAILLIMTVLYLLVAQSKLPDRLHGWLSHDGAIFGLWFAAFIGVILVTSVYGQIRRQWNETRTELALLALLPNLIVGKRMKPQLLRATLSMPMNAMLTLALVMLVLAVSQHLSPVNVLLALLVPLGCVVFCLVAMLAVVGGWQPAGLGRLALPTAISTLFLLSCGILLQGLAFDTISAPARLHITLGLLALWLVFAVAAAYIGRQGWRDLQRRPHPFLAH